MLEIGTGWGELAIRAARRGATVHSSRSRPSSRRWPRADRGRRGFAGPVSVELCDYRASTGEYDAVVSVEMIEAVGHEYWPTYFGTIDRVLAPGGPSRIQAIPMPHDRMLATRDTYTWINKYIFPAASCPRCRSIDEVTRAHTGLR